MDRYVIRGPRNNSGYPPGNQTLPFPGTGGGNNTFSDSVYYGPFTNDFPIAQNIQRPGYLGPQVINPPPGFGSPANINHGIGQRQISGIDPRYVPNYTENSQFMIPGHTIQNERAPFTSYGTEYQYPQAGQDRYKPYEFTGNLKPTYSRSEQLGQQSKLKQPAYEVKELTLIKQENQKGTQQKVPTKQPSETNLPKKELQKKIMSRSDKLQALYKSGPRAFSGPVEKVLKWHKSLQDIGILVFYEIVAKCVNIRPGEHSAKNLVVRDENGPAMQIVYYETDFLLPELKPPCTVRVIGKMMPGACRLLAFNIRIATGDDTATLSRRAAVAAHHVAKLCKEYGTV